jgi:protoheme ferro-lyase
MSASELQKTVNPEYHADHLLVIEDIDHRVRELVKYAKSKGCTVDDLTSQEAVDLATREIE